MAFIIRRNEEKQGVFKAQLAGNGFKWRHPISHGGC